MLIRELDHLGHKWRIVLQGDHIFIEDEKETLTGPFPTLDQAEEWVLSLKGGG